MTLTQQEMVDNCVDHMGFTDVMEAAEEATFDSVCGGCCARCGETVTVEPDCRRGWCDECGKNTVVSLLVLMGIV